MIEGLKEKDLVGATKLTY